MRLKFFLHKKSIFLYLCFLFTTYSCDGCMDDAEINNQKIDKRENYVVVPSVYKKTREKIVCNWNQIFNKATLDNINKFLPPEIKNADKETTKSFALVNNNIVLEGFLQCCLQEKIWIELLIEKIGISLQSDFEESWEKGAQAIGKILSELDVNNNNQEIYSKIFELNVSLNDNVLKPILNQVIDGGEQSKKDELKSIKWEDYKDLPTYLTVAHMLLCEIMKDQDEREKAFSKKWNEYYTKEIKKLKFQQ